GDGYNLQGGIGEVLFYRQALSAAEIADVSDYLEGKWITGQSGGTGGGSGTPTTDLSFAARDGSSSGTIVGQFDQASDSNQIELIELGDGSIYTVSSDGTASDGVNTMIIGGADDDSLNGASGDDAVFGADGADQLDGGAGDDALFGGSGNDTITGGADNDTLYGGAGADQLDGGTGQNWASYQDASSAIVFDADDTIASTGDALGDTFSNIYGVQGTDFADAMYGAAAAVDVLDGGAGNDSLYGRGGDDIFIDGAGADFYDGGDGNDIVIFSGLRSEYTVDSSNTTVTHIASSEIDDVSNVEILRFADLDVPLGVSSNNAPAIGDDQALPDQSTRVNSLFSFNFPSHDEAGSAFTDQDGDPLTYSASLSDGSALPSWLVFDTSTQTFTGTPTSDLVGSTITIRVAASDGLDSVSNEFDLSFLVAGVALDGDGSANDLSTIGNSAAGEDTLSGMGGDDTLQGGSGADTLDGGAGSDTASYASSSSAVNIDLRTPSATGGDAAGDTLISIESVIGSSNNDIIHGNSVANELVGGDGADSLFGHESTDTLDGGSGNDFLSPGDTLSSVDGGSGSDTIDFSDLSSALNFDLSAQGQGAFSHYTALENIVGTNFADTLTGDASANLLDGGAGNDTFVGGVGADTIIGGSGDDVVSYAGATSAVDIAIDGAAGAGGAIGDMVSGVEHLIGSDFNDTLVGNDLNNTIEGGLGDDNLQGLGLRDHLYGGDGNDSLYGGAGGDFLYGGAGADYISAGSEGDQLHGEGGDDTLIGGDGNDAYFLGRDTGHDTIDNYDTDLGFDVITYADDVANTDLWFQKVGNDLVVSVLGEASSATIKDWFDGTGAPAENFVVDMFIAGARIANQSVDVPTLLTIMDGHGAAPPDFASLQPNIQSEINAAWGYDSPPTLSTSENLSNVVIREDESTTLSFTVSDGETPDDQLTLRALTSGTYLPGIINDNGETGATRTITFAPFNNASGLEADIDVTLTDLAGQTDTLTFSISIDEAADAPSLTLPPTPSGNENQPIALNITAALSDTSGTEVLEIDISGPDTGWSLNNGQNLGGGLWSLTPADLSGLTITPPSGSGADIPLTVIARSTVPSSADTTNDTATTSGSLTVNVNGAPTNVSLSNLTIEENSVGDVVGILSATDPDAGNTHTFQVTGGADAANFETRNTAGTWELKLKSSVPALDYENAADRTQSVQVTATDQNGLASAPVSFTLNVTDENEKPEWTDPPAVFFRLDEDASVNDFIGEISGATDPEGADVDYSFRLSGGATGNAAGSFDLVNGGANTANLTLGNILDFETPPAEILTDGGGKYLNVTVVATDLNISDPDTNFADVRKSDPRTIKVYIDDVNEKPDLNNASGSVNENSSAGVTVATISATDPDTPGSSNASLRYYFRSGANGVSGTSNDGKLQINAVTGVIQTNAANAFDYESTPTPTYEIVVRDRNGGSGYEEDEATLTVNVGNLDDLLPETERGANFGTWDDSYLNVFGEVTEGGGPEGFVVAYVRGIDPDGLHSISGVEFDYSITNGNTPDPNGVAPFKIEPYAGNPEFGIITLDPNADLDEDHQASYALEVTATERDSGQTAVPMVFNISVVNEDELLFVYDPNNVPTTEDLSPVAQAQGMYVYEDTIIYQGNTLAEYYYFRTPSNPLGVARFGVGYLSSPSVLEWQAPDANYIWRDSVSGDDLVDPLLVPNDGTSTLQPALYHIAGQAWPIVFDLDDDGFELRAAGATNIKFDIDNDGFRQRTEWVGANDALLVLDRNGDGVIDNGSEISFVDDLPGAMTDLEGLAAFDSNEDGVLDANDDRFDEFEIWQDANQDAISQSSELMSLEEAGIVSLDLTPVPTGIEIGDNVDALILNTSTYQKADGSVGEIGDAVFRFSTHEEPETAPFETSEAPIGDTKTGEVDSIALLKERQSLNKEIDVNALFADTSANSSVQSLYDRFLGKIDADDFDLDNNRGLGSRRRRQPALSDHASITGDDGAGEAAYNRLIDAMAAFDSRSDAFEGGRHRRSDTTSNYVDFAASIG
ncbi:MAG: cadherin domain-containing protein, partial [Pseudomonadota bacterium]